MQRTTPILLPFLPLLLLAVTACGDRPGSVPEVPAEELAAQVPELDSIHSVMQPMWHEAFPAKDYEAIRTAVAEFQPLLAALETAELPGILRDKQERWEQQKQLLMGTYEGLKDAAETGNEAQMLAFAEAFHMNYEGLVRIVRPVVPELDAFHQHLYGLHHYYGPGYDLEKIGAAAEAMAAAIPPLQEAQLPARLTDLQPMFESLVTTLGQKVSELQAALEEPDRESVDAAIKAVHSAYEDVEGIFG